MAPTRSSDDKNKKKSKKTGTRRQRANNNKPDRSRDRSSEEGNTLQTLKDDDELQAPKIKKSMINAKRMNSKDKEVEKVEKETDSDETKHDAKQKKTKRTTTADKKSGETEMKPAVLAAIQKKWTFATLEKGAKALFDEWKSIRRLMLTPDECTAHLANKKKCRYTDIYCLDVSRVKLNSGPCDFIHANYISTPKQKKKYIATQGPMEGTVVEFWTMIYEQFVDHIVMLCQECEEGKPKCFTYYPHNASETMTYGDYTITCVSCDQLNVEGLGDALVMKRMFNLAKTDGETRMKICHLQWLNWPDKSVPYNVGAPIPLWRACRSSKAPIVVHCAAGIGRTGTFLYIEVMLQNFLNGTLRSSVEVLERMRNERSLMVQTPMQYLYAHMVILNYVNKKAVFDELKPKFEVFEQEYDRILLYSQEQPTQKLELAATPESDREQKKESNREHKRSREE